MLRRAFTVVVFLFAMSALMATAARSAELIAYFPMEENASPLVDAVSGATAEAMDGNGHLYSQPGPPGFGNAVGLDSDSAWNLDVDESAVLRDLVNNFTVAAWVYVDSDVAAEKTVTGVTGSHRVMGDNNAWDGDGWGWGIQRDGSILFTKNGIIDASTFDVYVDEDEWTHVAITVSEDDGIIYYVNGEEVEDFLDFDDIIQSPGNNGEDDWWGIARTNLASGDQWFPGLLDEVRVYSDLLTPDEIAALMVPAQPSALQAGDADMDFDFDQLDLVQVQIAAKYLTGQAATWGEGDWDGAPGGEPGNPPAGNGQFDQMDIIAALAAGTYLTGPYNAIRPGGTMNDAQTSIVYDAGISEDFVANDLTVVGSLAGGGDLGDVDLIYIPEPASIVLLSLALVVVGWRRLRG